MRSFGYYIYEYYLKRSTESNRHARRDESSNHKDHPFFVIIIQKVVIPEGFIGNTVLVIKTRSPIKAFGDDNLFYSRAKYMWYLGIFRSLMQRNRSLLPVFSRNPITFATSY